jgi:hypothetical protein
MMHLPGIAAAEDNGIAPTPRQLVLPRHHRHHPADE